MFPLQPANDNENDNGYGVLIAFFLVDVAPEARHAERLPKKSEIAKAIVSFLLETFKTFLAFLKRN